MGKFLTVFALVFICLTLDARDRYAVGQLITVVGRKTLKSTLNEIGKLADVSIIYSDTKVISSRPLFVNYVDLSLDSVLNHLLTPLKLTWFFSNHDKKTIVIRGIEHIHVPSSVNIDVTRDTSLVRISGLVVSEEGGGVPGATIMVEGSNNYVQSDGVGRFVVNNIKRNARLLISSIGFERQIFPIGDSEVVRVVLRRSLNNLDEKVVIGYGATTKRFLTGNVSKVTAAMLAKQPTTNPILSLQGSVPGLIVSQSNGYPGADFTVSLRGQNSLSNSNNLLYIIDGVPFTSSTLSSNSIATSIRVSPFGAINPSDIESIEVLKDADATSIYGSRGANGVVLITTKKSRPGKTKFDVNTYSGIGVVGKKIDLLNREEYMSMRYEALRNDSVIGVPLTAYDLNGAWDTTRNTDWQDLIIGNTAHFSNSQMSISGGSELTRFIFTAGHSRETTVLPKDYPTKKTSFRINISQSSNDRRLNLDISVSYFIDKSSLPNSDVSRYQMLAPVAPSLFDSLGKYNWQNNTFSNPLALMRREAHSITRNLLGSGAIGYRILKGLEFKTNLGYNSIYMDQSIRLPLISFSPSVSNNPALRSNSISRSGIRTWIVEPQLNYKRTFGDGTLDLMIGTTAQENYSSSFALKASNFLSDQLLETISAASTILIYENLNSQYRYFSALARVNYNWKQRYILNLTGRRDGSSRFGPGRKFGNFGAVGFAWIFSDENFIKDGLKFLSFGKLRGSYGTAGSQPGSDYQYLNSYLSYSAAYLGIRGLYPSRIANPDYSWELTKKFESAIELGFFNDRILFNGSYYKNRTGNQLVGYPLPSMAGAPSVQANLPAVLQNMGWEIELSSTNLKTDEFVWKSSLNVALPRTKLLEYPSIENSSYSSVYVVGKPLSIKGVYRFTGVDRTKGVYTYEDVNKDGNITFPLDLKFSEDLGKRLIGGVQNSFAYKGFEVDILFNFVKQKGLSPNLVFDAPGTFNVNQPTSVLKRWRMDGDISDVQKFTQSSSGDAISAYALAFNYGSNRYVDASFLRLRNVSISYNFPKNSVRFLALSNVQAYLLAQNLLTITQYAGFDPETQGANLPPSRVFTLGVRLSF